MRLTRGRRNICYREAVPEWRRRTCRHRGTLEMGSGFAACARRAVAAPMGVGEQAGVMELAIDIEAYTVGLPNPTSQAV